MKPTTCIIRWLGYQDYLSCWQAMQQFTNQRDDNSFDEIWLVEHPSVFTQGQNGKPEHVLNPGSIPIIKTDRGGQVTYHGPGQLVMYVLIDLRRQQITVRDLVSHLEQCVIDFLSGLGITAKAKCEAPGVYVDGKKICSIGLRIRRGCSFHGLAFNITTDLTPFERIHPCGYTDLKMISLADLLATETAPLSVIGRQLTNYLMKNLRYTNEHFIDTQLEPLDGHEIKS